VDHARTCCHGFDVRGSGIGSGTGPKKDSNGKPFTYPELRGRVAALLRRSQPRHGTRITQVGALRIHHPSRQVRVGETRIDLSANRVQRRPGRSPVRLGA
jgi:hypothetical protein